MSSKKPKRTPVKRKKKAKKPPPKHEDPFGVTTFGVPKRTAVATIEPATVEEVEVLGKSFLRHAAAVQYVTSQSGVSVRELAKQKPFNQLSTGTLQRWAAEDNWVERRQRYFDEITSKIESQIGKKLVESRVRQLQAVDGLLENAIEEVMAGGLEPNSKEGMIAAVVKLLEAGDKLRDKVAKEVVPEHLGGVYNEGTQVTPTLTDDEARAAAKTIMQHRRAKARTKVEAGEEKSEVRLKIVKGDG